MVTKILFLASSPYLSIINLSKILNEIAVSVVVPDLDITFNNNSLPSICFNTSLIYLELNVLPINITSIPSSGYKPLIISNAALAPK